MSNNLFNILVFLFIMVASGIYTLYFISKADIIKYHKEKGIKAIIPIVGEYTLFKNAFGKSNALLTYLLTNVLPIATYLTFCTVIKNVTIFWLIMTLPSVFSLYIKYKRNNILFNKCYGFGKVSSILSLIFPKATFIFVYLFGKNSFHGPKTPMNKSKAKKIRTIASILLLTVSLNSLFGVTSNAEPLQEEGTQVTEEVIDDEEIIEEPVEEEVDEPVEEEYIPEIVDKNHPDYAKNIETVKMHRQKLNSLSYNHFLVTEDEYEYTVFVPGNSESNIIPLEDLTFELNGACMNQACNATIYTYHQPKDMTQPDSMVWISRWCLNCTRARSSQLTAEQYFDPAERQRLTEINSDIALFWNYIDAYESSHKQEVKPEIKDTVDEITKTEDEKVEEPKKETNPTIQTKPEQKPKKELDSIYEPIDEEILKERPGMKEEFEERREFLESSIVTLTELDKITDAITSPTGSVLSTLGNHILNLFKNVPGIDKLLRFIDCLDFTISGMLTIMNYYVGNYTKYEFYNKLLLDTSSFIFKQVSVHLALFPIPDRLEFKISKFIDKSIGKVLYKYIFDLSDIYLDEGIEKIIKLAPKIRENQEKLNQKRIAQ